MIMGYVCSLSMYPYSCKIYTIPNRIPFFRYGDRVSGLDVSKLLLQVDVALSTRT